MNSEEWYLPVAGGENRLYVLEMGEGPPVVVIHGGWGAEHSYLLDGFEGLERDFRLIFYDQRGSLRSPAKPESISLDGHVDDLESLRSELGVERINMVAHSMGTLLALFYLAKHTDHVANLVLAGMLPVRTPTTEEEKALAQKQNEAAEKIIDRPELKDLLKKEGLDREDLSAKDSTRAWRIRFAGVNMHNVDRWRQMKGGQVFYSPEAGNAAGKTMPKEWDFTDLIESHPYRVTGIIGDHDYTDPGAEMARAWVKPLRNLDLFIVPNAGHCIWMDEPDQFKRLVRHGLTQDASSST